MRPNINLASQPYEDSRQFAMHWGAIIGGLLLLAIALSLAAGMRYSAWRQARADVAREQNVLKHYQDQQAQDVALLNAPANTEMRTQSEFLNQLIKRKEVSFTKIFSDLEKMMPPHLRVISVTPEIRNDQIWIGMALAGDSRDRAGELVRRMEKSTTFRSAKVDSENDAPPGANNTGDNMRFQISAEYVFGPAGIDQKKPAADSTEKTASAETPGGGK